MVGEMEKIFKYKEEQNKTNPGECVLGGNTLQLE